MWCRDRPNCREKGQDKQGRYDAVVTGKGGVENFSLLLSVVGCDEVAIDLSSRTKLSRGTFRKLYSACLHTDNLHFFDASKNAGARWRGSRMER